MSRVAANFVSRPIKENQEQHRIAVCEDLLRRANNDSYDLKIKSHHNGKVKVVQDPRKHVSQYRMSRSCRLLSYYLKVLRCRLIPWAKFKKYGCAIWVKNNQQTNICAFLLAHHLACQYLLLWREMVLLCQCEEWFNSNRKATSWANWYQSWCVSGGTKRTSSTMKCFWGVWPLLLRLIPTMSSWGQNSRHHQVIMKRGPYTANIRRLFKSSVGMVFSWPCSIRFTFFHSPSNNLRGISFTILCFKIDLVNFFSYQQ